jgi:peptidase E
MTTLPRILTIMGSGETAPTMVTTHRSLVSRLANNVHAVVIDTPFGFQENAPELAAKAAEYFHTSINVELHIPHLVRLHATHIPVDPVTVERGLNMLDKANYVFAGPGSPTYALRQWKDTPIADILCSKLRTGGIVTFASAAAVTLGKYAIPVYEIYKVGQDVHRLDGLDILGALGINAVVIPHYDNTEGAHHDTRFCYLGESRLQLFEELLDPDTYVLGVDEHTGLVIDLENEIASVVGNGTVTLRVRNRSQVFESGTEISLDTLRDPLRNVLTNSPTATPSPKPKQDHGSNELTSSPAHVSPTSLRGVADTRKHEFDTAINNRDADAALRACLDLENAIHEWSRDTLQGDDSDHARSVLRLMITQLGDAAQSGVRDPREVVEPWVNALLSIRSIVRAEKRYDLSDLIRDVFAEHGVEVRDTTHDVEWELRKLQ